ncbi:MAG: 1-acyl-sn-glycerol-3-phosphate acyltransferase [Myxococcota bacterium]|nr:1-acyl-sn-glycerol-3-phosphate acyltransferase [Myxococcota bacterium]
MSSSSAYTSEAALAGGHAHEGAVRRLARRLVSIPTVVLLALGSVLAAPLWIPLAAAVDLLRRAPCTALRLGACLTFYAHCQLLGLVAAAGLWLSRALPGAGRARYLERNFRLQHWWGSVLYRGVTSIFAIDVEVEGLEATERSPFFLFPRHASLADTLLPTGLVSAAWGTRLRFVLKRELLWDPCLDVVGHRVPVYFVDRFSGEGLREAQAVADLADDVRPGDGVVIFPEGTRFTPAKRERILDRLRASGDTERLARAERLEHVLPPRTGGPLALIERRPDVDVVFCAHAGFERAANLRDLWRGSFIGSRLRVRFWRIAAVDVPDTREGRVAWLFDQWQRIDAWLAETASEAA